MAYVKQGPWTQGSPFSADQATAMDIGIANAQASLSVDLGTTSGAVVLDALDGDAFSLTLDGAASISLANVAQPDVAVTVTLLLTSAGFAVTFDSSIAFPTLQPGTLAGAPDMLRFVGMPTGEVYGRLVEVF